MQIPFDLNKRVDLILRNFSPNTSERIVSIALPFLSLNPTTAKLTSAGMGAYEIYHHFQKVRENSDRISLARLAIVISSTVLGIVSPLGQFIVSNGVMFAVHTHELFQHQEWVKKAQAILKIADQIIHIGSIYYGSPRWIVLSLLSQICSELYQAQNFARKGGKWPETVAHLTMATFRSYATYSLLFPVQEKPIIPLAPVSQQTESEKFEKPVHKMGTVIQEKLSDPIPEQTIPIQERPLTQDD